VSSDIEKRILSVHEARVPHAYQDSLGYWTIGVGHLIDKAKGGRLPEFIIDLLLEYDIEEHRKRLPDWVHQLDAVRRYVLLDMTFNLGSLDGWPIFLTQVQSGMWEAAAKNMENSKWYKQVKTRAVRLVEMMRTGKWPNDI
jgi:lysozyme